MLQGEQGWSGGQAKPVTDACDSGEDDEDGDEFGGPLSPMQRRMHHLAAQVSPSSTLLFFFISRRSTCVSG